MSIFDVPYFRHYHMHITCTYVFIHVVFSMFLCALTRSTGSSASLQTACVTWGGPARDRLNSIVGRRTSAESEHRIVVNVSGLRFETHLSTVERFSRTLLGDATRRDRLVAFSYNMWSK